MARVRAPAAIGGLALALWLAWGHGFANYDTLYALVWGRQIADGESPSFDVSLAPTPHPLANLVGLLAAPLSPRGAEAALVVIAFISLGAVAWLTYELGNRWFGPAAGVLAALVIITREPVLSYGTRAYVDLWYLALVLGALLVVERRRAPFVLLALAGLVRPEAWLFSAALLGWRIHRDDEWPPDLIAIAATGPVLWLLSDWILTGSPLHSLTGTRENVETLHRVTGLQHVPGTLPRRIGEVLREPVLVGAAIGGVLSVWLLRSRALVLAAAGVLGGVAYCLLAAAGLPIITRYTFGVDAILAIFCGAGAFGWLLLSPLDPWRRRWMFLGGAVLVLLVIYIPSQARRLDRTRDAIATQDQIENDLWTVALPRCPNGGRIGVVNHRLVPQIALREDLDPEAIRPAPLPRGFLGTYVTPATPEVARKYVLDPRDPSQRVARPPRGLAPVAHNASWLVLQRCSPAVLGGE